ncbi:hypothetical protein ACWEO2_40010 [Nocardia sp. NPDC004278]
MFLTHPLWPADLASRVGAVVVPVLVGMAFVAAALLLVAGAIAFAVGRGARWLRYRLRWARALDDAGLTVEKNHQLLVPKLASVTLRRAADVVRVRMLPGQAPTDFAGQLRGLAVAFGAATCNLRLVDHRPALIELVFTRTAAADNMATVTPLFGGAA